MPDKQLWTWVRDTSTGHCYDVPSVSLERGHLQGVQRLNRPQHLGIYPRKSKHHVDLAGEPNHQSSTGPVGQDAAASAANKNEE